MFLPTDDQPEQTKAFDVVHESHVHSPKEFENPVKRSLSGLYISSLPETNGHVFKMVSHNKRTAIFRSLYDDEPIVVSLKQIGTDYKAAYISGELHSGFHPVT